MRSQLLSVAAKPDTLCADYFEQSCKSASNKKATYVPPKRALFAKLYVGFHIFSQLISGLNYFSGVTKYKSSESVDTNNMKMDSTILARDRLRTRRH